MKEEKERRKIKGGKGGKLIGRKRKGKGKGENKQKGKGISVCYVKMEKVKEDERTMKNFEVFTTDVNARKTRSSYEIEML